MSLQKLALLWMLEEKSEKKKSSEKEKGKSENKENHQGPEVRKPRSPWIKALYCLGVVADQSLL
jgi:hypothetical protein